MYKIEDKISMQHQKLEVERQQLLMGLTELIGRTTIETYNNLDHIANITRKLQIVKMKIDLLSNVAVVD